MEVFGVETSEQQIETVIKNNLSGEMQKTALSFVSFLSESNVTFYKDSSDCWKDKNYYWCQYNGECVCFIFVRDPEEPDNLWTVWSDESKAYENAFVSDEVRNTAWCHIDYCGNCGSCGGGTQKTVFGRTFEQVCNCTFRIDNANLCDLPFLKEMVKIRLTR